MHWKIKAAVQNAIAALPESVSYGSYYRVQRLVGGLRKIDPTSRLAAGVETWKRLVAQGSDPTGKTFFEVGTGRMVSAPLAYWLMGADRTITVDLNPYLKAELVRESIEFIADHRGAIERLFGDALVVSRLDELIAFARAPRFEITPFLDRFGVEYHAPSDAAATGLPGGSIDFHTSYTVMEHIPPRVLSSILVEARRLLRPDGLAVHGIDYSDHFSHQDASITAVNFLKYSRDDWDRLAGNRYMYMNRLRHRDYLGQFAQSGIPVIDEDTVVDERGLEALRTGSVRPHADFAGQDADELAIRYAWVIARPSAQPAVSAA